LWPLHGMQRPTQATDMDKPKLSEQPAGSDEGI
jgi:hypothetical protein